jgi:hypothetical protein
VPPIDQRPRRRPHARDPAQRRHGRPGTVTASTPAIPDAAQDQPRRAVHPQPASERPFAQQQAQARTQDAARAAAPPGTTDRRTPVIHNPSPAQVRAAHAQIVASVRRELGNTTGPARQQRTQEIVDRINTDPKLARVRTSVRHWQVEAARISRPQTTAQLKPGPPPHKVGVGVGGHTFASINTTAVGQAAARLGEKVAPGLHVPDAPGAFVKNAFGDLGTIAKGPFIAGVQLAGIGKDVVTGHPEQAARRAEELGKAVVQGTIQDWSHPGRYLREHPVLFGLDVTGAGAAVGRTAGALGRLGKLERASVRSGLPWRSGTIWRPGSWSGGVLRT